MKKKHVALAGALLVFIVLVISVQTVKNQPQAPAKIRFLKTYGSLNYVPENKNILQLAFVTNGAVNLSNSPTVSFDSDAISIKEIDLIESISIRDYTLWLLNMTIEIPVDQLTEDQVTVNSITLDGETHDEFGSLMVQMIRTENNYSYPLSLESHAAGSYGIGLKDYHATFINKSMDPILITKVEFPAYNPVDSYITIEETPSLLGQDEIFIDTEQTIMLNSILSKISAGKADIYYASPIVYYRCNEVEHKLALFFFVSGLQLTEDDLYQICRGIDW